MKPVKIIKRKDVIAIVEDYLDDKKSLDDLEQFATNILLIDEEIGQPCDFDPREVDLVKDAVWFLEETEKPWNSHVGKVDFRILKQILIEVEDKELAEDLLSLLRYRIEIEKILDLYLSGRLDLEQIDTMLTQWNYHDAVRSFKYLLNQNKNNRPVLTEILEGFRKGNVTKLALLLKEDAKLRISATSER